MTFPVAQTILAQLGGRKFIAMTGASSFSGAPKALGFRIPQNNKKKIAGVRIELEDNDLYTMVFIGKIGRGFADIGEVARHEGIYFDQMQEIFTSETGLYTSI